MRRRRRRRRADILRDLDSFRLFMGPLGYKYNDAQLRQLQTEMRLMAEILIAYYCLRIEEERKGKSDEPDPGSIPGGVGTNPATVAAHQSGARPRKT